MNQGIEDTQNIFQIAETMERRLAETGSHVRRVAEYARLLALKVGLSEDEAEMLKLASTPHDLGKIGIPDAILNKPGPLTPEEYTTIKTHVWRGHDLLASSPSPIIQAAARIVLLHHERWDGQGYPQGLKGEEIRSTAASSAWPTCSTRSPTSASTTIAGTGKRCSTTSARNAAATSTRSWWIFCWRTEEFPAIWERYNAVGIEFGCWWVISVSCWGASCLAI